MKYLFNALFLVMIASNSYAQNVGIGTTTPNQKLDIDKGRLRFTGNPGAGVSQGIEFTDPAGSTLNGFVGVYNDSITGLFGFLGSGWSFLHNNKNGNVGLQGNTNPRTALSFSNSNGNKISVYDNGDGTQYGIGLQPARLQLYVPSAAQDIVFGTGSSNNFTENMRIKGNGMVGIGTPTPDKPFTVKATGMGISQESVDGSAKVGFYTNANAAYVQTHNNTNLNFATNNASAQVTLQTATGNFGIGQINPVAKLDVLGTIKIADGSQGAGKVLTSDANGLASWQNNAYGNTERFQYQLVGTAISTGTFNTIYNYGTSTTNYYRDEIRIKLPVAGLYHFDINVDVTYSGPITDDQTITLYTGRIDTRPYPYLDYPLGDSHSPVIKRTGSYPKASIDRSFDIYANTPDEYFRFYVLHSSNQNYAQWFTITGHKIAD